METYPFSRFRTFLISIAFSLCQISVADILPLGEWALSYDEDNVTGVLEVFPDGRVMSKADEVEGQYFKLKDGKVLIILNETILVGNLADQQINYAFEGVAYLTYQPMSINLSPSTPQKLKEAKANHAELTEAIEQSKNQQLNQLINQNLAALASAFQLHMIIEGSQKAEYSDVVGSGKFLQAINPYNGESYEDLKMTAETINLTVVDSEGNEYVYRF